MRLIAWGGGGGGMAWGGSVVVEPGFRVRDFFLGGGVHICKGTLLVCSISIPSA